MAFRAQVDDFAKRFYQSGPGSVDEDLDRGERVSFGSPDRGQPGSPPQAGLCPMLISAVIRVESGGALWSSTPSLALPDLYLGLTLPTETYAGQKGVGMETLHILILYRKLIKAKQFFGGGRRLCFGGPRKKWVTLKTPVSLCRVEGVLWPQRPPQTLSQQWPR